MTFTYFAQNPSVSDVTQIRFEIGDTLEGYGILPDGSNFSDEEIEMVFDREAEDVFRTVAALCENLSVRYAAIATQSVGPRSEQLGAISDMYAKRAAELRDRHGGAESGVLSIPVMRVDGYSDDVPSDRVTYGNELYTEYGS